MQTQPTEHQSTAHNRKSVTVRSTFSFSFTFSDNDIVYCHRLRFEVSPPKTHKSQGRVPAAYLRSWFRGCCMKCAEILCAKKMGQFVSVEGTDF